jgi:hypothetical protein
MLAALMSRAFLPRQALPFHHPLMFVLGKPGLRTHD